MYTEEEVKAITGLTQAGAEAILAAEGLNEIPMAGDRNTLRIVIDVMTEPMFLLLAACGVVYLALGDAREAVMLLGFVIAVMGITIYQENKTGKALKALRGLSSPRALVVRDGERRRIAGRDVARGDVLVIDEGDRVPADAILLWGRNLAVDESLLTGESVPVRKAAAIDDKDEHVIPGGDDTPFLYSGTMITQGQGVARVRATGMRTELGKIGKAIGQAVEERTPLQKETARMVRGVLVVASALCLVVVMAYGVTKGDWLMGALHGLTLAMAMLPEEFPVVLTIFLALGAWRISKKNVLTRRVGAVEILGACTALCVDKTGTLTYNRMSVHKLYSGGKTIDAPHDLLPDEFHELVEYAILASKKDPFDPMEKALKDLGYQTLNNTEHLHTAWPMVEEYPLSRELLAISHAWERPDGGHVVSAKGAFEAVADLCHMPPEQIAVHMGAVNQMAGEGLRVIGVAKSEYAAEKLPAHQHEFDFKFLGLIGLADPVRETARPAIEQCRAAGIRVIMITGDYPVTAQNIAGQIGLENPDEFITGAQLASMGQAELREKVKRVNVFARVTPDQKLLLVNAMKANGEIVGMTGDGVNDAPSLKAAHIGVAMGGRGSDVARESAGLVLLDDDFSSIVSAARLGRRIFDNLKKAMAYIISVHVPIAGMALLPVLFGWPTVLFPAHIVFLELIIDPACSIVFESEKEEPGVMSRPPRNPMEPLFGRRALLISVTQGLASLLAVIAVFLGALHLGQPEEEARALAFTTLIITNLFLILANRSWTMSMIESLSVSNRSLGYVTGGALFFLGLVLYVPFLRAIFHFGPLHGLDITIALLAGVVSILWFELVKAAAVRWNLELLRG
jgi:Ca2+-transporting ATPase